MTYEPIQPIPYGRQQIDESDILAVCGALQSDFLTQGPIVGKFEQTLAQYCGVRHSLAVNSATSALHLACRAIGLEKGDILWTSPISFVASANCALYCDADIDFVDIDPNTLNMSVACLSSKLHKAKQKGKLPKIIVPVHFGGQPCEMEQISQLAREYGVYIIEDASHAIGARYQGQAVGNCAHSDFTIFSFHPVKIITTGEGGMLTSNNEELISRARLLHSHGITRDPNLMNEYHGLWYYQQLDLGYNYRMTDIQAALGMSQAARLDDFITERIRLAGRYRAILSSLPLKLQEQAPSCQSAWHLFVIQLEDATHRLEVFNSLRSAHISVNVHYIPIHLQPYYRNLGFTEGDFPAAEQYYARAISLPLYVGLSNEAQDYIVDQLERACR